MGGRLRGAGVAATAGYVRRLTRGNLDAPNLSRRLVRLTGSNPSSHVLSRSYTKSKAGLSGISPMATVRFQHADRSGETDLANRLASRALPVEEVWAFAR